MKCPICLQNINLKLVLKRENYQQFLCPSCDVVFTDPMESPGAEWYEKAEIYEYAKIVLPEKPAWYHQQFLKKGKAQGKTLLDIGCGLGHFLYSAKNLGCEVYGIDFDRRSVELAKKHFFLENIFPQTLGKFIAQNSDKRFDFVTFFEVLEHLDNPAEFLESVKLLLNPGSEIVLSVPNRNRKIDPLGDGDLPPNHLTKWSSTALSKFLTQHGFEISELIIKDLEPDDLVGFLRLKIKFAIVKKMVRSAGDSDNPKSESIIKKAKILIRIREGIFDFLISLLRLGSPFLNQLKIFKEKGTGLYCRAKLRE